MGRLKHKCVRTSWLLCMLQTLHTASKVGPPTTPQSSQCSYKWPKVTCTQYIAPKWRNNKGTCTKHCSHALTCKLPNRRFALFPKIGRRFVQCLSFFLRGLLMHYVSSLHLTCYHPHLHIQGRLANRNLISILAQHYKHGPPRRYKDVAASLLFPPYCTFSSFQSKFAS